jgi:aldose sugar dehydrogenase
MTYFSGRIALFLCLALIILVYGATFHDPASAQNKVDSTGENSGHGNELPKIIQDPKLNVELVAEGLDFPTTMAFLGQDDILVLEKNSGKARRVLNGSLLPEPLLDVPVATERERGTLGLAVTNKTHNDASDLYVFIYFTRSKNSVDGIDSCAPSWPYYCDKENEPLANRLYRYELQNDRLVNPKLLLDLPATPGPSHNGGAVLIGPDEKVYVVLGDLLRDEKSLGANPNNETVSQEQGGILQISQDGPVIEKGILEKGYPNKYYASGIRNSFGMDFDPLTGKLWDTENGPVYSDEINLVEPGFNSGWRKVQGFWEGNANSSEGKITLHPEGLTSLTGKGKYSDPEFEWRQPAGPTALKFLSSDKLGNEYENDMFVGDFNNGFLYHFDLIKNRTELALTGDLEDKEANTTAEIDVPGIKFGEGFGGITDIEVGPYDGYLYIVSHSDGKLYRIAPKAGIELESGEQ